MRGKCRTTATRLRPPDRATRRAEQCRTALPACPGWEHGERRLHASAQTVTVGCERATQSDSVRPSCSRGQAGSAVLHCSRLSKAGARPSRQPWAVLQNAVGVSLFHRQVPYRLSQPVEKLQWLAGRQASGLSRQAGLWPANPALKRLDRRDARLPCQPGRADFRPPRKYFNRLLSPPQARGTGALIAPSGSRCQPRAW